MQHHGLLPVWILCNTMDCSQSAARLLCPWDSPGKNTVEGCHALLQGIFPIQGSNPCLMSPALAGRFFTIRATWQNLNLGLSDSQVCVYNHSVRLNQWMLKSRHLSYALLYSRIGGAGRGVGSRTFYAYKEGSLWLRHWFHFVLNTSLETQAKY